MMNISGTFLPMAKNLIGNVFDASVSIEYIHYVSPTYNTATGQFTKTAQTTTIDAAIISMSRVEESDVQEVFELHFWIHHDSDGGLEIIPTTSDRVNFDSKQWRVTGIDPTYTDGVLIASRLTARTV